MPIPIPCSIRFIASLIAIVALQGCFGGQTGEDGVVGGPGSDAGSDPCRESGYTTGLDDPLPVGFTLRDLVQSVEGEYRAPAYWFAENPSDTPFPNAYAETEVVLLFEYIGGPEQPIYVGRCRLGNAAALPFRVRVSTVDGVFEQSYEITISGTPTAPEFVDSLEWTETRGACELLFSDGIWLEFSGQRIRGYICDPDRGFLRWPTECSGFEQRPLDEAPEGWPVTPRDALAALADMPSLLVSSNADTSRLNLSISELDDSVCYDYQAQEPSLWWGVRVEFESDDGLLAMTDAAAVLKAHSGGDTCPPEMDDECIRIALEACAPPSSLPALERWYGADLEIASLCLVLEGAVGPSVWLNGHISLDAKQVDTLEEVSKSWDVTTEQAP